MKQQGQPPRLIQSLLKAYLCKLTQIDLFNENF